MRPAATLRSEQVALIFEFDNPLVGTSVVIENLANLLNRTTRFPVGPPSGVELRFAAAIVSRGQIRSHWQSEDVVLDHTGCRFANGGNALPLRSPWRAFVDPVCGFAPHTSTIEKPVVSFGAPAEVHTCSMQDVANLPDAIDAIWRDPRNEGLDAGEYTLALLPVPPLHAGIVVAAAAIPFHICSGLR